MKIQKQLNELIKKSGLTAKEISMKTGISQAQLSQYKYGGEPTPEKLKLLEEFFNYQFTDPESQTTVTDKRRFTVDDAAIRMGIGRETLKEALKKDLFNPQIGIAVQHKSGTWKYEVFPERLEKYLKGEI